MNARSKVNSVVLVHCGFLDGSTIMVAERIHERVCVS
jgi:hypothetical protein